MTCHPGANRRLPHMTRATSEKVAPVSSTWYEGERLDNQSLWVSWVRNK